MKANEVIRLRRKELGLTMREVANKVDPMALKAVSAFQIPFQDKYTQT